MEDIIGLTHILLRCGKYWPGIYVDRAFIIRRI